MIPVSALSGLLSALPLVPESGCPQLRSACCDKPTAASSRFGSIDDARVFCETFFTYYNHEHRLHSGIGLHTAASDHYGTATEICARRAEVLDAAYAANPCRFRNRRPSPPKLPTAAWINRPTIENNAQKKS